MLMLTQSQCRKIPLADKSVHVVVTSPPFWQLRDYDVDGQLGLEKTPEEYAAKMVEVFREVWRVLRDDGTAWVNLGDSYASSPQSDNHADPKAVRRVPGGRCRTMFLKPKDLVGIPWRVAFALQADGWYLRSDIIWHKPNPMPESVTDRPTKSHEYLFLLSKKRRYFYDAMAIREPHKYPKDTNRPRGNERGERERGVARFGYEQRVLNPAGRNKRTVWRIATQGFKGAHFATYPPALVEPCIKAATSERGVCPECGAPWQRVTEKEFIASSPAGRENMTGQDFMQGWEGVPRGRNKIITIDWHPTCTCDAGDPVPAIVLNPFVGSGTTLQAARQLGRHGIGLDLSYTYLHDQARHRLKLSALAEWTNGKDATSSDLDSLPLFAPVLQRKPERPE